jgi:hypothetical protein
MHPDLSRIGRVSDGSVDNLDELAQRSCKRTGFVDRHRAGSADSLFNYHATVQESIDLSHNRGLVDANRRREV